MRVEWDIWIEPKDGSENGSWHRLECRDCKEHATKIATIYGRSFPHITYEVREINEAA